MPAICDPNESAPNRQRCVKQGIDQISDAFVTNGYALKGETQTLKPSSSGGLVLKVIEAAKVPSTHQAVSSLL